MGQPWTSLPPLVLEGAWPNSVLHVHPQLELSKASMQSMTAGGGRQLFREGAEGGKFQLSFNFVWSLRLRLRETSCRYCSYVALLRHRAPLSDSPAFGPSRPKEAVPDPLKDCRVPPPKKTLKLGLNLFKPDKPFSLASPCKDRFHPGPLTISERICPARTSPTLSSPGQVLLRHI